MTSAMFEITYDYRATDDPCNPAVVIEGLGTEVVIKLSNIDDMVETIKSHRGNYPTRCDRMVAAYVGAKQYLVETMAYWSTFWSTVSENADKGIDDDDAAQKAAQDAVKRLREAYNGE